MSVGKYLSLEEARKKKQLELFAKEHPHKGDWREFYRMLDAMVKPKCQVPDDYKAYDETTQGAWHAIASSPGWVAWH